MCILQHISGRVVNFNDAYRIGRRNSTDVSGPISSPPPPLLIKLSGVWDKRLIMASVRKLRDYTISKLYICEDLSPEAQAARASRRKALLASRSSPNQKPLVISPSPWPDPVQLLLMLVLSLHNHRSSSPSSSSGLSDGNASDSDTA